MYNRKLPFLSRLKHNTLTVLNDVRGVIRLRTDTTIKACIVLHFMYKLLIVRNLNLFYSKLTGLLTCDVIVDSSASVNFLNLQAKLLSTLFDWIPYPYWSMS